MQNKTCKASGTNIIDIPVIIVHRGNQDYLKTCIMHATNHGNKIILIGDKSNRNLLSHNCKWVDYEELISEKMTYFDSMYKHMSPNPYEYEKFCFDRHFIVYEYIKRNNINKFFVMDSDVLLDNIAQIGEDFIKEIKQHDVGLCWNENQSEMSWTISPHFSFWTEKSLESFINYLLSTYNTDMNKLIKKIEWHKENNVFGGICDMTLLYLWNNEKKIKSLNFCSNNYINWGIDNYFTSRDDNRYVIRDVVEKITFIDLFPFFTRRDNGKYVKASVIHAQGASKKYMKSISNNRFNSINKLIIDIQYFIKKRIKY